MPAVSSFDVTSTVDLQEVDNAVNQARKEIAQRYDFKGSTASIDFNKAENTLTLAAEDNMKINALWDILQTRLVRRNVPVKNLKLGDIETAAGSSVRRVVTLQQGISERRRARHHQIHQGSEAEEGAGDASRATSCAFHRRRKTSCKPSSACSEGTISASPCSSATTAKVTAPETDFGATLCENGS